MGYYLVAMVATSSYIIHIQQNTAGSNTFVLVGYVSSSYAFVHINYQNMSNVQARPIASSNAVPFFVLLVAMVYFGYFCISITKLKQGYYFFCVFHLVKFNF